MPPAHPSLVGISSGNTVVGRRYLLQRL